VGFKETRSTGPTTIILQAYLAVHGVVDISSATACCRRIEPGKVFGRMDVHFTVAMLCRSHSADTTYLGNIERRHCPLAANGSKKHPAPTVPHHLPLPSSTSRRVPGVHSTAGESSSPPLASHGPSQAVNENRNASFLQWRASASASQSSMALADTLVSLRWRANETQACVGL